MPRTLAQNAQYIAETIKPAIKSAIEAQGVTVPSTDSFLDYADRIGEIEGGGSGYQLKDLPTGSIATVSDAAPLPLNALTVSVEAVQDLHGYNHPWVGGAGKNLLNDDLILGKGETYSAVGISYKHNIDGSWTVSGTAAAYGGKNISNIITLPPGTYHISSAISRGLRAYLYFENDVYQNTTFTLAETTTFGFLLQVISSFTIDETFYIQVENGSTATSWTPYENICPISGWDSGEITVCDDIQSPTQTKTYTQQFPQTIYGAEWDVVDGELKVTDGYIASYNGETLPSTWISDRDVYASGTTPTTGAEVVYKLATPTTISQQPLTPRMLEGVNNLYADCGEVIEGEYFVDEGAHRYQLYDYIESDGTQVIDLGFAPTNGSTVTTSFVLLSTQTTEAFVYGATDNSAWLGFAQNPASRNTIYENNTSGRSEAYIKDQQYLLTLTASRDYTNHLCMFGFYLNGYAPGIKTKLCYCKYNDDFYLPCKRKSDGVFGLIDITNGTFLTDSASGNAFTGGNYLGVDV